MNKKTILFILAIFICMNNSYADLINDTENFKFLTKYGKGNWFELKNQEDLVDLSNIDCKFTSSGKSTSCKLWLSPTYNFPKDGVAVSTDYVRSGKVALKFKNGIGDCGEHSNGLSDCDTHRERSEFSMLSWENKEKWFKFSIFIPKISVFPKGAKNSLWQIHSKTGPVNFKVEINDEGDLVWNDHIINERMFMLSKYKLKGQWNDFVVYMDFDVSNKDNKIKIWANGELVVDYKGKTHNEKSKKVYMKVGIYKSHLNRANKDDMGTSIAYYDAIAIGDNCKELSLENEGNSCSKLGKVKVEPNSIWNW